MTVTTALPRPHAQGPLALVRSLALLLFLLGAVPALHAASGDDDDAFYRLELGVGGGFGFGLNDVNSKLYGTPTPAAALLARFPLNPNSISCPMAGWRAIRASSASCPTCKADWE